MSYTVTTNYDNRIPSWPGNGTPFSLIACHDTEGGQGRVGAIGTIQFLIDRADRGASYHELWWYHETTDEFGVIRIVPTYRAAGSVAPQRDKYTPTTWVKNSLGVNAWDPNQGIYAVSIAGRVADVDRYSRNPKFLAHAHRRMLELWKELGLSKRAEHFQFNPATRSDWGKLLMPALGGLVTSDKYQPPTEAVPMDWITKMEPMPPTIMVVRAGASYRRFPDLSETNPYVAGSDETRTVIAKVNGMDFGAGPLWYVILSSEGGLKVFHSQDVVSSRALVDPATVVTDADDAEEDALIASLQSRVQTLETEATRLNGTVTAQTGVIANLKTELGEAQSAAATALSRAEEAERTAESASALRTALRNFLG